MPPKVAGAGKKKKRTGKRKAMKGRGLLGSIGGALGSAAGNMLGGFIGLGKKRRGRGMDLGNLSPVTMGKPPGFIQA